jgi:glutamine amidotransferase
VKRVAIIDYKLCNLDSIGRAVEACGAVAVKTTARADLEAADMLILPGVGHFGAAMDNLEIFGLVEAIRRQVAQGKPFLGICLGMQLLAERSEEAPGREGLGLIGGSVLRLKERAGERVPHMGWNVVDPVGADPLLAGVEPGKDFYFVHSYHFAPAAAEHIVATTPYCGAFASVVRKGAVAGTQFHPEKSQATGFALLHNFLGTAAAEAAA